MNIIKNKKNSLNKKNEILYLFLYYYYIKFHKFFLKNSLNSDNDI